MTIYILKSNYNRPATFDMYFDYDEIVSRARDVWLSNDDVGIRMPRNLITAVLYLYSSYETCYVITNADDILALRRYLATKKDAKFSKLMAKILRIITKDGEA